MDDRDEVAVGIAHRGKPVVELEGGSVVFFVVLTGDAER